MSTQQEHQHLHLAPISLPWSKIRTVLLDMDGTLLDLRFDNYFWRELVPLCYAERHALSIDAAQSEVRERTQALEGTLDWYCLDYWSNALALDIAALKREVKHLIAIRPQVRKFLEALRDAGKTVVLVTNAHQDSLSLKMEKTQLAGYFDALICAHDLQQVKEQPAFWSRLQAVAPFDPARTLLIDDYPAVLESAQQYGIAYLLAVRQPDSSAAPRMLNSFPAVDDFSQLLPIA